MPQLRFYRLPIIIFVQRWYHRQASRKFATQPSIEFGTPIRIAICPNACTRFTSSSTRLRVVPSIKRRQIQYVEFLLAPPDRLQSERFLQDPRIDRLLLRKEETNARGVPSRVAELADKVSSTLVEIEKLRAEVEVASRQVVTLASRESALQKVVQTHSTNGVSVPPVSGSNALAFESQSLQRVEDEPDFEFQRERLETVSSNLKARKLFVQRTQDLIATRLTAVHRMLELFTRIEDGATTKARHRRRIRRVRRRR